MTTIYVCTGDANKFLAAFKTQELAEASWRESYCTSPSPPTFAHEGTGSIVVRYAGCIVGMISPCILYDAVTHL